MHAYFPNKQTTLKIGNMSSNEQNTTHSVMPQIKDEDSPTDRHGGFLNLPTQPPFSPHLRQMGQKGFTWVYM